VRAATCLLASTGDTTWRRVWDDYWLHHTVHSFWARFGWMDIQTPEWWNAAAAAALAAAFLWPWLRRAPINAIPAWLALPSLALLLPLSLYNTFVAGFQPQGRYLLPAVAPLVLRIFDGLSASRRGPWLLLAMFVVQNLVDSVLYLRS
jgi:hypothetical protein